MEAETFAYRTPGEAPLPPDVFVPVATPAHRPRQPFRVKLDSPEAVEVARRHNFPVFALTGDVPTRYRYPMVLGPILFVDETWQKALVTRYPNYRYRDATALATPTFEDLVTMVTAIDPAAGRAMLQRNPAAYDPEKLAIAIVREGLVRWATALRFQDFAPAIPKIGKPELRRVLRQADRENHG